MSIPADILSGQRRYCREALLHPAFCIALCQRSCCREALLLPTFTGKSLCGEHSATNHSLWDRGHQCTHSVTKGHPTVHSVTKGHPTMHSATYHPQNLAVGSGPGKIPPTCRGTRQAIATNSLSPSPLCCQQNSHALHLTTGWRPPRQFQVNSLMHSCFQQA